LPAHITADPPLPCSAAEHRQLDFWIGDWVMEYTREDGTIVTAENRVRKDFGGCVISERFVLPGEGPQGSPFIGASYSIFDKQTGTWRQLWVDNMGDLFDLRGGQVEGQPHVFEMVNIEPRGPEKVTLRMVWEDVTDNGMSWRWQQRQPDGSWTDRWVLRYKRR